MGQRGRAARSGTVRRGRHGTRRDWGRVRENARRAGHCPPRHCIDRCARKPPPSNMNGPRCRAHVLPLPPPPPRAGPAGGDLLTNFAPHSTRLFIPSLIFAYKSIYNHSYVFTCYNYFLIHYNKRQETVTFILVYNNTITFKFIIIRTKSTLMFFVVKNQLTKISHCRQKSVHQYNFHRYVF